MIDDTHTQKTSYHNAKQHNERIAIVRRTDERPVISDNANASNANETDNGGEIKALSRERWMRMRSRRRNRERAKEIDRSILRARESCV